MSEKSLLDLAAEITTCAMDSSTNYIQTPESVGDFYETIYRRISKCACITREELLKSPE